MQRSFVYIFLSILVIHSSSAQEENILLDPITITASVSSMPSTKTGRNIVYIDAEQIGKLPVNSIDDLIRYLPGIEVQSRGPMGAQSNITIRGGTFQQVLILLDGIRLNDPLTGHFNSYIPIASSEIDHIEILKGASSAIYGSDAVGGIVHIITKTFQATQGVHRKEFSSQLIAGDYGLINSQAGFNLQKNNTAVSAGVGQNKADGQPLRGTNGFFKLNTISLSAKQYLNKNNSIAYRFGYDDRNFNAQNFYTNFLSDTATEKVIGRWHHLNYRFQKEAHALLISTGIKATSDKYQFRKLTAPNTNHSKIIQSQVIYQYKISSQMTLIGGSQFLSRSVKSNNRGDHDISSVAAFFIANLELKNGFNINPSLRWDWNERSGSILIPQVSLSYQADKVRLRANAGRSNRDADFTELYNNYQSTIVSSGGRVGNPFLEPESAMSYEIGSDYLTTSFLKISATWFQRFHNDLIDYVATPYAEMPRKHNLNSSGIYSLAKNIDQVNTRGAEMDIYFQKDFPHRQNLVVNMGAIILKSTSSDTIPSLYVSNHAKFLTNFNIHFRFKSIGLSINGLYKYRIPRSGNVSFVPITPDYFIMNTKVETYLFKDHLKLFMQADNLFNRKYADILGTVMPRRWLMAGIRIGVGDNNSRS